jgi:hypothetical protein
LLLFDKSSLSGGGRLEHDLAIYRCDELEAPEFLEVVLPKARENHGEVIPKNIILLNV